MFVTPSLGLTFNSIQTIKPQAFCDRGPVKDTD